MRTKALDCMEMKRQGAQRIMEETRGMTPPEQEAYWQRKSDAFHRWQQTARKMTATHIPPVPDADPNRFDCVEMMHEGGRRVQKLLSGMSEKEKLRYWQQQAGSLARELRQGMVRPGTRTRKPKKARSVAR